MSRPHSHSFTGVVNIDDKILKTDSFAKVTRQELVNMACYIKKPPPRLRKLSLATITYYDDPYKKRSLNQFKLERSNSLPDTKTLHDLNINFTSSTRKKNELVKTRSVTFHPETICLNAAADNDFEELNDILENDIVDINYKNSSGLSMIHHAAAAGSFECLKLLLENDAEMNALEERGFTPLDLAIRGGYFDCALLLINAGARVEKIVNGLQL